MHASLAGPFPLRLRLCSVDPPGLAILSRFAHERGKAMPQPILLSRRREEEKRSKTEALPQDRRSKHGHHGVPVRSWRLTCKAQDALTRLLYQFEVRIDTHVQSRWAAATITTFTTTTCLSPWVKFDPAFDIQDRKLVFQIDMHEHTYTQTETHKARSGILSQSTKIMDGWLSACCTRKPDQDIQDAMIPNEPIHNFPVPSRRSLYLQ